MRRVYCFQHADGVKPSPKRWLQIMTSPNSQMTDLSAIIQLKILIQKQINLTMLFYYEIFKYSWSILANILRTKQVKMHLKFQYIYSFLGRHFHIATIYKVKNSRRETFTQIICRGISMLVKGCNITV